MRRRGFTLVELLVAMAILGGVLTLVAVYFGDQRDLTNRTQSRSEVQDRVRLVMQMVTQDMQMAGSRGYLDANGGLMTSVTSECSGVACLSSADGGSQDSLGAQYVSTLRNAAAQACRAVAYSFAGDTLRRSDVPCGDPAVPADLAPDIPVLDVQYQCSNNTTANTSAGCPAGSYPRGAKVTVIGQSSSLVSNTSPATFATASGSSFTCPAGRICLALTQEVLTPNLRN